MAELSAVPFSALPQASDGYTVLYENNQVCRSEKKLSELVGDKTSSFLTKEQGDSLYQEKGDYLVEDDITGKLDKEQYANDSATFLTAHQDISNKLDTTAFSTVSSNFLTAHQSLDEYATQEWVNNQGFLKEHQSISANEWNDVYETVVTNSGTWETETDWTDDINAASANALSEAKDWVEEQNYITGVDLTNYYTKSETSGKEEIEEALEEKQDKLTFGGTNNTITSINNSAVGGGGVSNSWKQLSEDYHSSGEVTDGKFCVYVGKYNTGYNDSYTMGRENYSEPGVNIGYANKINIEATETLPGNFNFGKSNVISGNPGGVNLGQNNSAFSWGVNLGENNKGNLAGYNFGNSNSANNGSINIGERNSASLGSYNIGYSNTSDSAGYTFGYNNSANNASFSIGNNNKIIRSCYAIGERNTAFDGSYTIGSGNSAEAGSFIFGKGNKVHGGGLAFGTNTSSYAGFILGDKITANNGSVAIGSDIIAVNGSIAIGARNYYANECSFIIGNGNTAIRGTTTIGDSNTATYTDIIGNNNVINKDVVKNSSLSSEDYTKHINYDETISIRIKNFVAGLNNTADYAKNAYILGNSNKIISDSADYINEDNDGYTFIYGWQNSADRNYDMAIGYKSIASGGENIAIGAPFETITGYNNYEGYFTTGSITPVAKGYKNFVLRGNVTGIANTAINSNLTGDYVNENRLGDVTNNCLINSFVSAITTGTNDGDTFTGIMLNNTVRNSIVILSSVNIRENQITHTSNIKITGHDFNYNNLYHDKELKLSGLNINDNTITNCEKFNVSSQDICRNTIFNCIAASTVTANKLFADNIIGKSLFATSCSSIQSVNENIIFNTYIDSTNVCAYRGWGDSDDSYTTLTRNFLFGSYIGNYVYGTFSFSDNSNTNSDGYKISNTCRVFNFGDNTINKSENSFVFGEKNNTSAIARTFVLGTQNNINKTKLTNVAQDYVNDIFVFGNENNVIADNNNVTYPILERNRIFGIKNLIKSNEHLNDNLIVGNNNSISYNTTKPSKPTIRQNVYFPSTPYSSENAAFATYRNNILGNGNRISQCITDSLIVGAGNFVFDTIVHTPSMTADYNSIYTLGVGNIAYDGSNQLNIGYNNETSGHFAEAIGDGIVAKGQQLIIGKCNAIVDNTNRYSIEYDSVTDTIKNIEQSGVIFAIGNGTYDYAARIYDSDYIEYYDKNKNKIPSANVNNEEYITRSNALIVSANGVVSANNYKTSAGYVITEANLTPINELIQQLQNKITALETIISSNSANWVLTSQA